MNAIEIILAALIFDALVGDPKAIWDKFPHPAAMMGKAISFAEARSNHGSNQRIKGLIVILGLCAIAAIIGVVLQVSALLSVLLGGILLSQNSLSKHVKDVAKGLDYGLAQGREAVAMIVGRDAQALDENGVARSAIESAAENFSDGVVAPIFWFLIFGLPGIVVYKMVNTADSMIGYKNERYGNFGWATAKLDDLLNWIPARISGLLICVAHTSLSAFKIMLRDAPKHRSPNAGWPEAAMAGVLGVAIAGPRTYDGTLTDDPFVNADGRRDVTSTDVIAATRVMWRAWSGLVLGLVLASNLV